MNSEKSETSVISTDSNDSDNKLTSDLNGIVSKRQRIDSPSLEDSECQFESDSEFQDALYVLQENKQRSIRFIKTQYDSIIQCANSLATFEKERINEIYAERLQLLQKKLQESNQVKTRRMAAEEAKSSDGTGIEQSVQSNTHKKEMCYLTVPLSEDDIVCDLQYMAHCTLQLCDRTGIPPVCVAAPLSNNRLLLNERVIEPNTPCILRNGNNQIRNCVFTSTIVKEKDNKEKRKEPEIVVKVSATRKRRFPVESLCSREIELVFEGYEDSSA